MSHKVLSGTRHHARNFLCRNSTIEWTCGAKHRHILNVARALRFLASLPIKFWAECALTAWYLINRTPCKLLTDKTPFEMLYGRPPAFNQLRVFGCLCYAHNQNHNGDKFASRSRRCAFLGYRTARKDGADTTWTKKNFSLLWMWSFKKTCSHIWKHNLNLAFLHNHYLRLHHRLLSLMTLYRYQLKILQPLYLKLRHHLTSSLPALANNTVTPPTESSSSTEPSDTATELGRGQRTKKPLTSLTKFVVNTSLSLLSQHQLHQRSQVRSILSLTTTLLLVFLSPIAVSWRLISLKLS